MQRKSWILRVGLLLNAILASRTVEGALHFVEVGNGDHTFNPDSLMADIGDIVVFQFFPLNHSVVAADFKTPCVPREMVVPRVAPVSSGFKFVAQIPLNPPTYNYTVVDNDPIFFYCSAPDSCIKYGMTAVINPTPEKNITDFHARALKANYMIQPGGSWPSEAESNAESQLFAPPLTTVQVTVTQASTSAPTSAANQQSPNSTRHLSTVEIAGTAIGAAAVLGLIGGLSYYLARRKATDPEIREKPPVPGAIDHGPFIPPPTPGYMSPQQVYHDSFADRGSYAYNYAPDPRSFPAGVIEEKPLPSQAWGNTVQPSAPVAGASDPVEIDSQTSYGTPGQYQPVSPAGPALSEFNGQDTPNRFSTMSPDSFKGKDH